MDITPSGVFEKYLLESFFNLYIGFSVKKYRVPKGL